MLKSAYCMGLGALAAGAVAGCGVAVGEEGVEETATTTQPVSGYVADAANDYAWGAGTGTVQMTPRADSACFLTEIHGRFRSSDDRVRIRSGATNWELTGSSTLNTNPVGHARCISSTQTGPTFTWAAGEPAVDLGSTSNRACFLVDVYGKFDAVSDYVETRISGSHWFLTGGTDSGGGAARCVSGVFVDAKAAVNDGEASEFGLPLSNTRMDPYACFLSKVGGDWLGVGFWPFASGGVNIHIDEYPTAGGPGGGDAWVWDVASRSDSSSTTGFATARCIH